MDIADQLFEPLKLVNVVVTGQVTPQAQADAMVDSDDDVEGGPQYLQGNRAQFDLARIAANITVASAEYYPRKFAALKLCRVHPFSKALFFRSGKLVCVGNVTQAIGRSSMEFFSKCIDKALGGGYVLARVCTQNIVATTQLMHPVAVDLNLLARLFPGNTQYEAELFPGCSFRYGHNWKKVVNIFNSGKIVMTGVKDTGDMKMLARLFHKDLLSQKSKLGIISSSDLKKRQEQHASSSSSASASSQ